MAMLAITECTGPLISVMTLLVLLISTGNYGIAVAQSPAALCASSLATLYPCLAYATSNSTSPPPQGCCTAFQSVVKSSVVCICQISTLNSPMLGFSINLTQVLALPRACQITPSPFNQCKVPGLGTPAPSPFEGDSNHGVGAPSPTQSAVSTSPDLASVVPPASLGSEIPPAGGGGESKDPTTVASEDPTTGAAEQLTTSLAAVLVVIVASFLW